VSNQHVETDTQTCENDTFACEIHKYACRFLNIFLLRLANFFRIHVWVLNQHARVWFLHAERDFHTFKCDFYTQGVLYTRKVWLRNARVWFRHAACGCHTLGVEQNYNNINIKLQQVGALKNAYQNIHLCHEGWTCLNEIERRTGHSGNETLVAGHLQSPIQNVKKGPIEGPLGAFWIFFLYGMSLWPFDPSPPLTKYIYTILRDLSSKRYWNW
jgi:hypothetical protein